MAITHTGTAITAVQKTGTAIDSVTHTGTTVFSSVPNHIWVYIYESSSQPSVDLGIIESSEGTSEWINEVVDAWPPNNYTVGTTAAVWDGGTTYYTYQVQEE